MKADAKNYKLIVLIAKLRDHIDMHRIIGLNVRALHETDISHALLGYLPKSAQESLALYICKIYQSSTRNELNSIPASIEAVPVTALSGAKKAKFAALGAKYGNHWRGDGGEVLPQGELRPLLRHPLPVARTLEGVPGQDRRAQRLEGEQP